MSRSIAELKEIVRIGGGISLDAASRSTSDLKELARQTKVSGATLVIRNASAKTMTDLKDIARQSPGKVVFEL